jgi:hypothetical protein
MVGGSLRVFWLLPPLKLVATVYQETPCPFPSKTPNIAKRCLMRLVHGIVDLLLKDAYRHYVIYRF